MKGHSQIFCVFGPQPPVSDEGEADGGKRVLLARRVNKYCVSVKNDKKFVLGLTAERCCGDGSE